MISLLYAGRISIDEAEIDQRNLLENNLIIKLDQEKQDEVLVLIMKVQN